METLHPNEIELGLDRVAAVRDRLGLTPPPFAVVTVGGTNGKGSTVAMLEHSLHHAGYRVGAYTSPHLVRFNERVRVGTCDVTDQELIEAFGRVEAARRKIPLTYFEFGTLAAVDLFRQLSVDVAILEVGLGGRLDAVNVWDADVSIVSSIGIDHVEYLGPDRESIGREKAGIFRSGRPAICGDPQPPASLVEYATSIGARLYRIRKDFDFETAPEGWTWRSVDNAYSGIPYPSLRGDVQLFNAAAVFMALDLLVDRFPVTIADRRSGLTDAVIPGRFQTLPGRPVRVFDVAHNTQAAQALARTLRAQIVPGRTLAVCAMLRDKPMTEVVAELSSEVDAWFIAGLDGPRGSTGEDLHQALITAGVAGTISVHADVEAAYAAALADASENDRVVTFGSFHTVGGILRALSSKAGVMAEKKDTGEQFNPRHRIVGAVILVALAVIFLPMLLSERPPQAPANSPTSLPVPDSRVVPAESATGGPRTVTIPIEPPGSTKPAGKPAVATSKPVEPPPPVPAKAETPQKQESEAVPEKTTKPKAVAKSSPKPSARTTVATGWYVQVGVFSQMENARRLQQKIQKKGYKVRIDPPTASTGQSIRVEVGSYKAESEARSAAARIQGEFDIKGLVRQH